MDVPPGDDKGRADRPLRGALDAGSSKGRQKATGDVMSRRLEGLQQARCGPVRRGPSGHDVRRGVDLLEDAVLDAEAVGLAVTQEWPERTQDPRREQRDAGATRAGGPGHGSKTVVAASLRGQARVRRRQPMVEGAAAPTARARGQSQHLGQSWKVTAFPVSPRAVTLFD